jgi:hypothetical protein
MDRDSRGVGSRLTAQGLKGNGPHDSWRTGQPQCIDPWVVGTDVKYGLIGAAEELADVEVQAEV